MGEIKGKIVKDGGEAARKDEHGQHVVVRPTAYRDISIGLRKLSTARAIPSRKSFF